MSNRNLSKAIQNLTREVTRLCRSMTKSTIDWLLRFAFVVSRRVSPNSGIILPTTIMLILVVSLSVGALTYRAYTRNVQVIAQNQQRVIYNAATPAIDRARSKLEFLFDSSQDQRYPSGGVPQEERLLGMLVNDGVTGGVEQKLIAGQDPYTLTDEERTTPQDNTWYFKTDTDGDGKNDSTVVYSILFQTPGQSQGAPTAAVSQQKLVTLSDKVKANAGIVRHGPLTTETGSACQLPSTATSASTSVGWFNDPTNTAVVRKNFQVDVLVVPDSPKAVATTLEFHQDREISKGNKWGAWFRDDLEVFPGPAFAFNGAMHTEGNLIVGSKKNDKGQFQAYLISSKNSCLYPPIDNSEISITTGKPEDKFKGVIAAGLMGIDVSKGGFKPHYQLGSQPKSDVIIDKDNDTSKASTPKDVYSDKIAILTEDKRQTDKANTGTDTDKAGQPLTQTNTLNRQDPTYSASLQKRITFKDEATPYIDDLSRADDRWGPKPTYKISTSSGGSESAKVPDRSDSAKSGYGYAIPKTPVLKSLIDPTIPAQVADRSYENAGSDGYWERRARGEGLRILVGERLELGNPFGWVTPRDANGDGWTSSDPTGNVDREGDPLYPPEVKPYPVPLNGKISHLQQQRRTLRDNLAAVQATALYHADFNYQGSGPDYPFACLATTSHPGTPSTLRQSINFVPTRFIKKGEPNKNVDLLTDFFLGRGTNGWEFQPPAGNLTDFVTAIAPNKPLGIALRNLAHFAGDPDGAFPPKQEVGTMHPYPALTMWGNFSNLRRALDLMDASSYDVLSSADKTYIQTAACTVGMLAYEIDTVQQFDPTDPNNNTVGGLGLGNTGNAGKLMLQLGMELYDLMDEQSVTETTGGVLPKALLKRFGYPSPGITVPPATLPRRNPRDFYNVPPEAYIEALRQRYTNDSGRGSGLESVNNAKLRMAELIMLNFQIRRDRTFGFRPSPSFGHYAISISDDTANKPVAVYPSACDPDLFAFEDTQDPSLKSKLDKSREVSIDSTGLAKKLASSVTPDLNDTTTASLAVNDPADLSDPAPKIAKARLGLSRLCGALSIPAAGYDLTTGYNVTDATKARPVVMPKFPSLYYLFPEQSHGLAGGKKVDAGTNTAIPDAAGEYDTRQPGTPEVAAFTVGSVEEKFLGLTKDDKESYVVDTYINKTLVAGSYQFKPVQAALVQPATPLFSAATFTLNPLSQSSPPIFPLSFPSASGVTDPVNTLARFPDENRSVFPVDDLSVSEVAGKPRELPGGFDLAGVTETWKLPFSTNVLGVNDKNANVPTNIIEAPTTSGSGTRISNTPVAVPFLDKAFFDGRQLMLARVLDLDVGMMRSDKTKLNGGERGEPLMPMSGIVYAFREDAVREDGIARPPGARMNARNPADPQDPSTATYKGVSIKSVDNFPDPERRIHGFRLKNGRQVKRDKDYEAAPFDPTKNYRGLSLFTDQPLYIQGDLNRHQTGADDTAGEPLEEFKGTNALIRGQNFDENKFYNRGGGGSTGEKDTRFASLSGDRWRPTELLADSISIISDNFCDGSISDMFVNYANDASDERLQRHPRTTNVGTPFKRAIYQDSASGFKNTGLYGGLGCRSNNDEAGFTSFRNSDRPNRDLPPVSGKPGFYDWLRENPNVTSYNASLTPSYETNTMPAGDNATPIKISRSGLPLLRQPVGLPTSTPFSPTSERIAAEGTIHAYGDPSSAEANIRSLSFGSINASNSARKVIEAKSLLRSNDATNVNAIVVSGIVPSQPGNTYGGLHNFPRFIEDWGNSSETLLDYAGSFLQLSFSNYATAPFQMVGWEKDDSGTITPPFETSTADDAEENISYYGPPQRQWGYDVGLQLAPAGPAASRFVIVKTPRNEFYSEPQINDPYIQNLCKVAKSKAVPGSANLNCDT